MSKKRLIIFGNSTFAELAEFYFRYDSEYHVEGFTIDATYLNQDTFLGKPVVAFEEVEDRFPPDEFGLFVAVGYSGVNSLREEKCLAALKKNYSLPSYISSKASVFPDFSCGWNSFILEDNTIQPFARIGDGVTLWSGNHIGHHSRIDDFAFISSQVVVSGQVRVGSRSFLGVNSTINDNISIGKRCVVGSGAIISADLADESVVQSLSPKFSKVPSSRLKFF